VDNAETRPNQPFARRDSSSNYAGSLDLH